MQIVKNKYRIKIPKNINVIYSYKKNIITIVGPLAKKSLKLKIKLEISKTEKLIKINSISFSNISNSVKKEFYAIQGTTVSLIKQLILETSYVIYEKLKLVGVGYRAFDVENYENRLIFFKLGYSHPIYIKIPDNLQIFCLKKTKLFLYGNSYQNVTQAASNIRFYKKPEPYKGKGILYETEKLILKEGKKI
jgi:large subunit ribosomal protein L6